jgi:hypothetical protein
MCYTCLSNSMKQFLGLELNRHTVVPPWARAMANQDIPPWQKESPFNNFDKLDSFHNFKKTVEMTEPSKSQTALEPLVMRDKLDNLHNLDNLDLRHLEPVQDWQPPGYFTGEDAPMRQKRLLPNTIYTKGDSQPIAPNNSKNISNTKTGKLKEVKRSWPEPREKNERRTIAANYAAVEIHGFFGLIDDGSAGEGRMLIVHVPRWVRGYFLDIKQGDDLHVYHSKGKRVGAALNVLSTGRHKYYPPGSRVTTCTVCVPEEQWAPFSVG